MIKLIATDLDETLLPEGTFDLNPEYYEVIRELKKRGILFVAASGRHSTSIRRLFECVSEDVVILAGNGSCIMYQGKTIDVQPLDYGFYQDVLAMMRQIDSHLILADHADCVWTDSSREDLIRWISEGYHTRVEKCADLAMLEPPVLKAAMHVRGDAAIDAARIRERFEGCANIMAAGPTWVDIVANGADKGSALKKIQEMFGISREETAAFGDNENDIGMLELAGQSYAVENARRAVRDAASHVIGPMREDAVLKVIKSWL